MDFYDINCLGKIKIERLSALPTWTAADEGRMLLLTSTNELYYGDDSAWVGIESGTAYTKSETDAMFASLDNDYMHLDTCVETAYGNKTFYNAATVCGGLGTCYSSSGSALHVCQSATTVGHGIQVLHRNCCGYGLIVCKTGNVGRCPSMLIYGCVCGGTAVAEIHNCSNCNGACALRVYNNCGIGIHVCSEKYWGLFARSQCSYALYAANWTKTFPAAVICNGGGGVGLTSNAVEGGTAVCARAFCCSGCLQAVAVCAYSSGSAAVCVYGGRGTAMYICAAEYAQNAIYARGRIIGNEVDCATVGYASSSKPVAGNGSYYSFSSRHIKHLCNVCVTECLRKNPLRIYKYTHDDSNMTGFDEFIGPTAEDYHKTFDLDHEDCGEDYLGLSDVAGTSLGLAIENMDKIDILKLVLQKALKRIKKLEEKKDGSIRKIKQK